DKLQSVILTPTPGAAPRSSLVHMFELVRRRRQEPVESFHGRVAADGSWTLDFERTTKTLRSAERNGAPQMLLGTAFGFVHLLDFWAENKREFRLPPGSRVMETGGYKGRSRTVPKPELHALISHRLGIPESRLVSEYGMSELSSQAYDQVASG